MAHKVYQQGRQLCLEGDLPEGIKLIEDAMKRIPREHLFLNHYGFWLLQAKRYSDARVAVERALKVTTRNAMSWNTMFTVCLHVGDARGVEGVLGRVRNMRSKPIKNRFFKIAEKEQVLKDYLEIRDLLAACKEANDTVMTIRYSERGLRLAPADPVIMGFKLWGLFKQDRYEDFIKIYREAHPISLTIMHERNPVQVGQSYLKLQRIDDAVNFLELFAEKNIQCLELREKLRFLEESKALADTADDLADRRKGLDSCVRVLRSIDPDSALVAEYLEKSLTLCLEERNFLLAYNRATELRDLHSRRNRSFADNNPWYNKIQLIETCIRISGNHGTPVTLSRCFLTLQMNSKSTKADAQNNYRRLLKKYHPDKNCSENPALRPVFEEITKELTICYKHLENLANFETPPTQIKKYKPKKDEDLTPKQRFKQSIERMRKSVAENDKRRQKLARERAEAAARAAAARHKK